MVAAMRPAARVSLAGLYALTPDMADTGLLAARAAAAIDGGAAALQYRNKSAAPALRREQARVLRELCAARGVPIIVNDDVELAAAVAADGVHLGRDDAGIAAARARLGPDVMIGVSCYDSLERAAAAVRSGANYIAFGSFFPSAVKPQALRAAPSLLSAAKARWRVAVVAIGGITAARAGPLIAAGADAVAVISAVFEARDVRAAAREFAACFDLQTALHDRGTRR